MQLPYNHALFLFLKIVIIHPLCVSHARMRLAAEGIVRPLLVSQVLMSFMRHSFSGVFKGFAVRCVAWTAGAVVAVTALGLALQPVYAQPDAAKVSFQHAKGEVAVASTPQTVVVFDLATLDILNALGVEAIKGVPAFKMPDHLKKYEGGEYTKVGSLFEPDYEAIRALRPDVIFSGRRSESRYEELSRLAPTADMAIDESRPIDSVFANVRKLGALFGKSEKAEELIARTQQSIDELRKLTPDAGTALVLLSSGGRINSYGPGSRFGMVYDVYGFSPVREDSSAARHGQSISFEYILQSNPDWLLVMDRDSAIGRDGAAAQRLLDNALIKATNAARKGQIVYLDAVNWYVLDSAGIDALHASVEQLRAAVAASKR